MRLDSRPSRAGQESSSRSRGRGKGVKRRREDDGQWVGRITDIGKRLVGREVREVDGISGGMEISDDDGRGRSFESSRQWNDQINLCPGSSGDDCIRGGTAVSAKSDGDDGLAVVQLIIPGDIDKNRRERTAHRLSRVDCWVGSWGTNWTKGW